MVDYQNVLTLSSTPSGTTGSTPSGSTTTGPVHTGPTSTGSTITGSSSTKPTTKASTPTGSTPSGSTKTPPNSDDDKTTTIPALPISELHFLTFNPSSPEQEAFSWYQYTGTYNEEEYFGVDFDTPDVLSTKSQSCSLTLHGERYLIGGYGKSF